MPDFPKYFVLNVHYIKSPLHFTSLSLPLPSAAPLRLPPEPAPLAGRRGGPHRLDRQLRLQGRVETDGRGRLVRAGVPGGRAVRDAGLARLHHR